MSLTVSSSQGVPGSPPLADVVRDATELGATAIKAALERAEVAPEQVQHVIMGQVIQADPAFVRYESAGVLNDCDCIMVPLKDFTHDLDAMADRMKDWRPPEPRYKRGVMAKYANSVSSAAKGAVTN